MGEDVRPVAAESAGSLRAVVASIDESDRDAGREGAREIAGMYLANKFQNIRGSADTLLELVGIEMDELAPVAEAMEHGGRLAAKAKVTLQLKPAKFGN